MKRFGKSSEYAKEFEQELNAEIEARIADMERDDYDFGERFSKADYVLAVALSVLSLILLIIGAFL